MDRLLKLYRQNGAWTAFIVWRLAVNRLCLVVIRLLLGVDDVYFQGVPRILCSRRIRFGKNFQCGRGAWIEAVDNDDAPLANSFKIIIGDNVVASEYLHLAAVDRVEIGDGVLIGSGVLISDHSHGRYGRTHGDRPDTAPVARALSSKGGVKIGRNVWIGDGAKILAGVTIGDGSVIGANTVVSQDVPPGAVYAGASSARIVKYFDVERQEWRAPDNG